jgi:hypothetical protein
MSNDKSEPQTTLSELTHRLRELGASDELIAVIHPHIYAAYTKEAEQLAKRFHSGPVHMHTFADELSYLTRRLQGLGVAMLGLAEEHKNDPYIEGVCQLVTDIEDNAHRLSDTFNVLWQQQRADAK